MTHIISKGGMSTTEARRILSLIDSYAQGELNRIAIEYMVATPQSDASGVVRRLRSIAEGVLQNASRMDVK